MKTFKVFQEEYHRGFNLIHNQNEFGRHEVKVVPDGPASQSVSTGSSVYGNSKDDAMAMARKLIDDTHSYRVQASQEPPSAIDKSMAEYGRVIKGIRKKK